MRWKLIISSTLSFFLGIGLTVFVLKTGQFSSTPPNLLQTFPTKTSLFKKDVEGNKSVLISTTNQLETVKITRVVDGDTIEATNGQRIRYIGIDTPETKDPRKPVECFGKEATARNKELVLGKQVFLEKDISDTDKYGRLLRYVWIILPDRGEVMVNEILVEQGYAFVATFPPDVKYQQRFLQAQRRAREEGKGLWSDCPLTPIAISPMPAKISEEKAVNGSSKLETKAVVEEEKYTLGTETDCIIKGNINRKGEKIYHLPGCGSYDKTVIDESKGEHWFCTEEEALKAGWRKAKNC